MTDPKRLLDDPDALSLEERRSLLAGRHARPPEKLPRAVWLGLAAQLKSTSAAAGGAGAVASKLGLSASAATAAKWVGLAAVVGATSIVATEAWTGRNHSQSPDDAKTRATGVVTMSQQRSKSNPAREVEAAPPTVEKLQPTGDELPPMLPPVSTTERNRTSTQPTPPNDPLQVFPPQQPSAPSGPPSSVAAFPLFDLAQDEARQTVRARELLRSGQVAGARRALQELDTHYPNGALLQEREALLIEVLVASGQTQTANDLANRFYRRYPDSPHSERLRSLVGR